MNKVSVINTYKTFNVNLNSMDFSSWKKGSKNKLFTIPFTEKFYH